MIFIVLAIAFYFVVAHLYSRFMRHQKVSSLKALRYLTTGRKTMEEVAKHLGIPHLEAKILLRNLEHQYAIESQDTPLRDSNGNQQNVKSVFRTTSIGNKVVEDNPDKGLQISGRKNNS